jgi:hypothetical protein
MWDWTSIRSLSLSAGLILGALSLYFPRPRPVAPVPIAVSASQPAPTRQVMAATSLVPLESVRVSIARQPEIPKPEAPPTTHQRRKLSREMLCVSPGASHACQATFAAVLQSAAARPAALDDRATAQQPLRFHKRAAWVRRIETVGKEGIPFVRVPRGPENELVVGIDRNGVLGFSLRQVSDGER